MNDKSLLLNSFQKGLTSGKIIDDKPIETNNDSGMAYEGVQ